MKIMTTAQLSKMISQHPHGGIVFAEYKADVLIGELKVTDGAFGATCVVPWHDEFSWEYGKRWKTNIVDYDWSIGECNTEEMFAVFDVAEIEMMLDVLLNACATLKKAGLGQGEKCDV